MHIVSLDFTNGTVSVDSAIIEVDGTNVLARSIARLCSPPLHTDQGLIRYRLLEKASVGGKAADAMIEVGKKNTLILTFLFDFIEFFETGVLESKILKACEKSSGVKFVTHHPSIAYLEPCEWGSVLFSYDAKQGDLCLQITHGRGDRMSQHSS